MSIWQSTEVPDLQRESYIDQVDPESGHAKYLDFVKYASLCFPEKMSGNTGPVLNRTEENVKEFASDEEVFLTKKSGSSTLDIRTLKSSAMSTDSDYPTTVKTEITSLAANKYHVEDSTNNNFNGYAKLLGAGLESSIEDDPVPEDTGPVTTQHLLSWAAQIAKGMEYLTTHPRRSYTVTLLLAMLSCLLTM